MTEITSKEYDAVCYMWARLLYYVEYCKDEQYQADTLPQDRAACAVIEGLIDRVNAMREQAGKEDEGV